MASGRTLHVRCATWEQVEVFHTRKLRRGRFLSMKVPFQSERGAPVTLNLELPNRDVVAIAGIVLKSSPVQPDPKSATAKADAGKTWLEVELIGFTQEVVAQLRRMAAGLSPEPAPAPEPPRPPPPVVRVSRPSASRSATEALDADERAVFQHLTAELRRLRSAAVHEVLGVPHDAGAEAIRRGWMDLMRRYHPDLVARRNAPAITHLAEELTILVNRAYDRLRVALVAEGRASSVGPALSPPPGWLVGFEDIPSPGPSPRGKRAQKRRGGGDAFSLDPMGPPPQAEGSEAFELRARAMLGEGDPANAQEVLAAALCVYPRSRPLRSLYYVASAISALAKGEVMLATSHLETAVAHYEHCSEAAAILELLQRPNTPVAGDEMKRLFR
jgi:DnaJ-domain-containing protein 1